MEHVKVPEPKPPTPPKRLSFPSSRKPTVCGRPGLLGGVRGWVLQLALLVGFLIGFQVWTPSFVRAASQSKLKLQVVPMNCQFEVVNDGSNDIVYLTPAECGQAVPTPDNPGQATDPDTTVPLFAEPTLFDLPGELIVDTPTRQSAQPEINLDTFANYMNGAGLQLSLKRGQVVHFTINIGGSSEAHSVTIKEIGPDYVVLTIASTPFDTTLYIGNMNQYDVNADGALDLEITLNSISGGVANLTFRRLDSPLALTHSPSLPAPNDSVQESSKWPYILIAFVCIGICATLLYKRLHRNKITPPNPGQ
jgi:hypothetical protein